MTSHKHLKRLVRLRMDRTGESYTTARSHLLAASRRASLDNERSIAAHGRHGQEVVFSPDGRWVVSGGQDRAVRFHDAATSAPGPVLQGHTKLVNSVIFGPDGRFLASASSDRSVWIWTRSAEWRGQQLGRHRDAVIALAAHPDGRHLISGGYDGRVILWDIETGEFTEASSPIDRVTSLVCAPDGAQTAEAGQGGEIVLRSMPTLEESGRLDTGAVGVSDLAISADGLLLASADALGTVTLWDLNEAEPIRTIGLTGPAQAVAISVDGRYVAAAWDRTVGLWGMEDAEPVATVGIGIKGIYSLAFDPSGTRLAQTGADGKVRIWDIS